MVAPNGCGMVVKDGYSGLLLLSGASCFFCQAEDGIRDLVRSRGLGDVYKRQAGFSADPLNAVGFFDSIITGRYRAGYPDERKHCLSLIHI